MDHGSLEIHLVVVVSTKYPIFFVQTDSYFSATVTATARASFERPDTPSDRTHRATFFFNAPSFSATIRLALVNNRDIKEYKRVIKCRETSPQHTNTGYVKPDPSALYTPWVLNRAYGRGTTQHMLMKICLKISGCNTSCSSYCASEYLSVVCRNGVSIDPGRRIMPEKQREDKEGIKVFRP